MTAQLFQSNSTNRFCHVHGYVPLERTVLVRVPEPSSAMRSMQFISCPQVRLGRRFQPVIQDPSGHHHAPHHTLPAFDSLASKRTESNRGATATSLLRLWRTQTGVRVCNVLLLWTRRLLLPSSVAPA